MPTKNKRFMLTVLDDIEADAAEVKRSLFYSLMQRCIVI